MNLLDNDEVVLVAGGNGAYKCYCTRYSDAIVHFAFSGYVFDSVVNKCSSTCCQNNNYNYWKVGSDDWAAYMSFSGDCGFEIGIWKTH